MKRWSNPLRWVIWGFASFFYFYEYYVRVSPTVMTGPIMESFSVQAETFGFIIAFYLYAYGAMQLPVGVLVDRYGARSLLTVGAALTGGGAILFAISHIVPMLGFSRLCQGIGSSFGFVSMLYVCTHWFPQKRWALMIGLGNALGMLGAVIGEGPMSVAVNLYGWRASMFVLGLIGVMLAVVIPWVVKNHPKDFHEEKHLEEHSFVENVRVVARNYRSWIIAFASFGYYTVIAVLAALWCTPFLETVYGVQTELAGFASSMIFLGYLIGGPIFGHYSDKIKKRKLPVLVGTASTALLLVLLIYVPNIPFFWTFLLLFAIGLASSCHLLTFSFGIELNPYYAKGTSAAFVNTVVMLGASLFQPLVGYLLDVSQAAGEGYSAADYRFALSVIPIAVATAFVSMFFLKDKQHQSKVVPLVQHEIDLIEHKEEDEDKEEAA